MYHQVVEEWLHNKNIQHKITIAEVVFSRRKDGSRLTVNWGDQKLIDMIDKLSAQTKITATETQDLNEVL